MEADDLVTVMVQKDVVLDYRDQQGHDFVMHILYHVYGLITTESDEKSPGAAQLYEKFLLGVVGANEEASVSGLQHSECGTSISVSQDGGSMSFSEAQRLVSLYFSLCTKKPSLLQLVFDVYARAGKSVKQAIHRHISILLRALGSSYSELFCIISDPPMGSENLLMLVLQILAEQTTPSPDLIVKHLYETKLKDATILIPMLSSLSKTEGSAHTGPALTPAEVLVAIHDIVPEKEGIALKKRQFWLSELRQVFESAKADLLLGFNQRDAFLTKLKLEHAWSELDDFKAWFDILSHRCPDNEVKLLKSASAADTPVLRQCTSGPLSSRSSGRGSGSGSGSHSASGSGSHSASGTGTSSSDAIIPDIPTKDISPQDAIMPGITPQVVPPQGPPLYYIFSLQIPMGFYLFDTNGKKAYVQRRGELEFELHQPYIHGLWRLPRPKVTSTDFEVQFDAATLRHIKRYWPNLNVREPYYVFAERECVKHSAYARLTAENYSQFCLYEFGSSYHNLGDVFVTLANNAVGQVIDEHGNEWSGVRAGTLYTELQNQIGIGPSLRFSSYLVNGVREFFLREIHVVYRSNDPSSGIFFKVSIAEVNAVIAVEDIDESIEQFNHRGIYLSKVVYIPRRIAVADVEAPILADQIGFPSLHA